MNNSDYLAKVKRPPPPQLAFGINFLPRIHLSFLLFSYFLHDPSQFGGFQTTCENSVKEKKIEITGHVYSRPSKRRRNALSLCKTLFKG
jgi:hypothetical protein